MQFHPSQLQGDFSEFEAERATAANTVHVLQPCLRNLTFMKKKLAKAEQPHFYFESVLTTILPTYPQLLQRN